MQNIFVWRPGIAVVISINICVTEVIFASNLSSLGLSHVGLFFINKEQKNASS